MTYTEERFVPVSVVIPCYCSAQHIERALNSVANQTRKPSEIILVDDASPDNTLQTLYKIQSRYPVGWIKVLSLPVNSGPASARNYGWKHVRFDYVAFLDSDDSWNHNKIEIQYNYMQANPDLMLSAHYCIQFDSDESLKDPFNIQFIDIKYNTIPLNRLIFGSCFSTRSVMLRTSVNDRFPEGWYFCEDLYLWLKIASLNGYIGFINSPLAYRYKEHYGRNGLSSHLLKMEIGELKALYNIYKSSDIGLCYYFLSSFWSVIKFFRRLFIVQFR